MTFFGASGHAKVILEAWLASGGQVTEIIDDNPSIGELLGWKVRSNYKPTELSDTPMVISIGSNRVRKLISGRIPAKYQSVIHPSAVISPSSCVGAGTAVLAHVVINASTSIGKHAILNTGCVVEHDCVVEDFAHIAPKSTLCGNVLVGEGTHVGAGATIIQGIKVGKWVTIGAGAVVINDVPDFAVVVGVPGKIIKFEKPST